EGDYEIKTKDASGNEFSVTINAAFVGRKMVMPNQNLTVEEVTDTKTGKTKWLIKDKEGNLIKTVDGDYYKGSTPLTEAEIDKTGVNGIVSKYFSKKVAPVSATLNSNTGEVEVRFAVKIDYMEGLSEGKKYVEYDVIKIGSDENGNAKITQEKSWAGLPVKIQYSADTKKYRADDTFGSDEQKERAKRFNDVINEVENLRGFSIGVRNDVNVIAAIAELSYNGKNKLFRIPAGTGKTDVIFAISAVLMSKEGNGERFTNFVLSSKDLYNQTIQNGDLVNVLKHFGLAYQDNAYAVFTEDNLHELRDPTKRQAVLDALRNSKVRLIDGQGLDFLVQSRLQIGNNIKDDSDQ
ncbi:MAG: DEAD/DEAH box helicase family protein, partial [Candidatus Omnitrophota bacterium]|nr:DEAD/DEAH box helicase family protein [Candidatus Omnitrophota bacterium]